MNGQKRKSFCCTCASCFSASAADSQLRKIIYFLAFLITANCLLVKTDGCYLRNCPVGKWEGKRSNLGDGYSEIKPATTAKKVCPLCGPVESPGRCMGPHICCIPGAGCLIGPDVPHTSMCSKETDDPRPCMPEGIICGEPSEGGVCGSDGVCCTAETCKVSTDCTTLNPYVRRIMKTLNNL